MLKSSREQSPGPPSSGGLTTVSAVVDEGDTAIRAFVQDDVRVHQVEENSELDLGNGTHRA